MKKFNTPTMDVEKFEIEDIITASGCTDDNADCPDDFGIFSIGR